MSALYTIFKLTSLYMKVLALSDSMQPHEL